MTVSVANPSGLARPSETVEVPWSEILLRIPGALPDHLLVKDATGNSLPSQVLNFHPENRKGLFDSFLFQYDFASGEKSASFTIEATTEPVPPFPSKVFARYVPERFDDFAWENDRIAHRIYGQALETPSAGKSMMTGSGIDVCRDVRSMMPDLICLMLTSFADDEAIFASVMAGAAGYVLKQIKARDLISDVHRVAAGESLMDPRIVARVVERISNPPKSQPGVPTLTPQEKRILDLIAEGMTNRQIAESMFLAEHTVKNYITGLLRKLKMSSRTEAAIYATKLKAQDTPEDRS